MTIRNTGTEHQPDAAPLGRPVEDRGVVLLTTGGLIAAFGLASCCALPIFLGTAGISTAWLVGFAELSAPHRSALLLTASLCFAAAGVLLFRQRRTACPAGSICSRPAVRGLTVAGLLAGLVLLYLGYMYV